jgi:hypothetical protein
MKIAVYVSYDTKETPNREGKGMVKKLQVKKSTLWLYG